jgi:hypothetical protein
LRLLYPTVERYFVTDEEGKTAGVYAISVVNNEGVNVTSDD